MIDIDGAGNTWPNDSECGAELSAAPLSLTPRGGSHRIFRQPAGKAWRNTESRLGPRVDTRADGGYIVAPPSVLAEGSYRWAPGMELDEPLDRLPEPPPWLVLELDRLAGKAPTIAQDARSRVPTNEIPEGQRNATLARLGGVMRRVGMTATEIAAALHRVNSDRCHPPLDAREVERIAVSIARYPPDEVAVALVENHYDQMFPQEAR